MLLLHQQQGLGGGGQGETIRKRRFFRFRLIRRGGKDVGEIRGMHEFVVIELTKICSSSNRTRDACVSEVLRNLDALTKRSWPDRVPCFRLKLGPRKTMRQKGTALGSAI